jgi:hypothetical protein
MDTASGQAIKRISIRQQKGRSMIYDGYAEPYEGYGEVLEEYAEPYEGYGEVLEGYGEAPWWWRPNYQMQVRNPLYNVARNFARPWWSHGPQGWQRPNAQYPGAAPDRRLYLRCSAWRGPAGMVPGPGMPLAPGMPGATPGLPGTPGAPGMPPGAWGGGRRRRRRRR